jgi:hypothetical protein
MMAAEKKSISIRNSSKSIAIVSLMERHGKMKVMERWKIKPLHSQDIFIKKSLEQRLQTLVFYFDEGYQLSFPLTTSQRIIIEQPVSLVPSKRAKHFFINLDCTDSTEVSLISDND